MSEAGACALEHVEHVLACLLRLRDVLVLSILVVDAFAPLSALLAVEHLAHRLVVEPGLVEDGVDFLHQRHAVGVGHEAVPEHALALAGVVVAAFGRPGEQVVVPRVEEHRCVIDAEDGVVIVVDERPVHAVLGVEHGVLHRLVNGTEAQQVDVVGTELRQVEVVFLLAVPLLLVVLAAVHPRAERLQRCGGAAAVGIAELEGILPPAVEAAHVGEQGDGVVAVEELHALHLRVVERLAAHLQGGEAVDVLGALVVVEVVLAEAGHRRAGRLALEEDDGEAVDGGSHVVGVLVLGRPRLCLRAQGVDAILLHVSRVARLVEHGIIHESVPQASHARVVRARRLGIVGLQAPAGDGGGARLEGILAALDDVAVSVAHDGVVLARLGLAVDAEVLSGIGDGRRSLQAYVAFLDGEILRHVGHVAKLDVDGVGVPLALSRLVADRHDVVDVARDNHDGDAGVHLVGVDAAACAVDVVACGDAQQVAGVDGEVAEGFVGGDGAVVDAYGAHAHRAVAAADGEVLAGHERVAGVHLHGPFEDAVVDDEDEVAVVARRGIDDEGQVQAVAAAVARLHRDASSRRQLSIGGGDGQSRSAAGHVDHGGIVVDEVAHLVVNLDGLAHRLRHRFQRAVAHLYARSALDDECAVDPSALAVPLEVRERRADALVGPRRGVGLGVAAPLGVKVEGEPVGHLLNLGAAAFDHHADAPGIAASGEGQRVGALGGGHVVHCGDRLQRGLDRLDDAAVLADVHLGTEVAAVVDGELVGEALILRGVDGDAAVGSGRRQLQPQHDIRRDAIPRAAGGRHNEVEVERLAEVVLPVVGDVGMELHAVDALGQAAG